MSFGVIMWNQKMEEKQNYVTWYTDSFIVYMKINDIYIDIAKDVEARFDISSDELHRPLPKEKRRVIGLMRDWLGEKTMKKFTALRVKIYSYLNDNNDENKKTKSTKKCVIKRKQI